MLVVIVNAMRLLRRREDRPARQDNDSGLTATDEARVVQPA